MVPQEQVMALEVPYRVECLEGLNQGGSDTDRADLQVEHQRVARRMVASTVLGLVSDLLHLIEAMQVMNGWGQAGNLRSHDLLADQRIDAPTKCEYDAKPVDTGSMSSGAMVVFCLASGEE